MLLILAIRSSAGPMTAAVVSFQLPPMGRLLSDYYSYRGWNEEGIPTPEKLEDLGLAETMHG